MTKIPLILLPGTLCDASLWAHQAMGLSDIAEVHIGDITQASTIEEMAKLVLENAPGQFALAGLSLGGIVAMEIVRQAPERVLKLALLDTTANPPSSVQQLGWNQMINRVENGEFKTVVEESFLPNLLYKEHPKKEELLSKIVAMVENIGEKAYLNQLKAVTYKPNGFEVLPTITCSTLLLVGQEDILCTVQMHNDMHKQIPHAELVIIEQSGHLSTIEQPGQVTDAMRRWLLKEEKPKKSDCKNCEKCRNTSKNE